MYKEKTNWQITAQNLAIPRDTNNEKKLVHLVAWQKCALQWLPSRVAVISVQQHMVICWCLERER